MNWEGDRVQMCLTLTVRFTAAKVPGTSRMLQAQVRLELAQELGILAIPAC